MTTERRGGPRVPDGIARPDIVQGSGPNRSDLSALPGTPGTPLPDNMSPTVQHGQEGRARRALADIPLEQFRPKPGGLLSETESPSEPVTAGIGMGAGAGPESLIQGQSLFSDKAQAKAHAWSYAIIQKLATMPSASPQTKLLAQRFRANLPVGPYRMPLAPQEVMDKMRREQSGAAG